MCIEIAALLLTGCNSKSVGRESGEEHRFPDTLRVATLYSPSSYFLYRDEEMGYDYELVRSLAAERGVALDLHVAPSLSAAVEWLDSGWIDLIAYDVPVTSEYAEHAVPCGVVTHTRQVLVQPRKSDSLITDVTQLVGRDVYVESNSRYHQRLQNLNDELGGGIKIHTVERDTLNSMDLIEMVSDGDIPLTIVDNDIARVNRTYFPNLDVDLDVSMEQRGAWAVSPVCKWLGDSITAWLGEAKPRREQERLLRRYFELSKSDPTYLTYDFSSGHASPFDQLFKSHSADYDWDWRLLAAQAFVESRFDAGQVSWAGARGIMQIMPATARAYGVDADRLVDNDVSIGTSLKIIRSLDKALTSKVPDKAERQKFVLAAYNAGIAHIYDAISIAKATGKDPKVWDGNVERALLLKSLPEYYNSELCKYGYFRGRETTAYVKAVTNFYNKAKAKVKY